VLQRAAATACRIAATSIRRCMIEQDTVDTARTAVRARLDLTVSSVETSTIDEPRLTDVGTVTAMPSVRTAGRVEFRDFHGSLLTCLILDDDGLSKLSLLNAPLCT